MTAPVRLPPPLDFYNRPPKELAGYSSTVVDDGEEIGPPTRPASPGESITLLTVPGGRGFHLVEMPEETTDYIGLSKVKFDATPYNAARLVVNVHQPGVTDSRCRLFYSVSGEPGTFVNAGIDLVGDPRDLVCKIDNQGIRTGEGPISATAQADVYWAVLWEDGDGIVTPVIGNVYVQFMVKTYRACTWITVTEEMVDDGETMVGDVRWEHVGLVDGFQSGCNAPTCLAQIAIFRFGSGAVLDHYRHRQFTVEDFPLLEEGAQARLTGEMTWSYAHLACGPEANPNVRLTVAVNGVTFTNVPSGFPPYDTAWKPFTIPIPVDGLGVDVAVGVFGDSGNCSLSLIGTFRNFKLEVLQGGGDCI